MDISGITAPAAPVEAAPQPQLQAAAQPSKATQMHKAVWKKREAEYANEIYAKHRTKRQQILTLFYERHIVNDIQPFNLHLQKTRQRFAQNLQHQQNLQAQMSRRDRLKSSGPAASSVSGAANLLSHTLAIIGSLMPPSTTLLVPIRIDIVDSLIPIVPAAPGPSTTQDTEPQPLRDTFCWNLFEQTVTPTQFATIMVNDLGYNAAYIPIVAQQIQSQLDDFMTFVPFLEVPNILVTEKSDEEAMAVFKQEAVKESRVAMKLSITLASVLFQDTLEVDLRHFNFDSYWPEYLAHSVCLDLGLGGEFYSSISHLIREHAWIYFKCLKCAYGFNVFGEGIDDGGLLLPSFEDDVFVLREPEDVENYTPYLTNLSTYELERLNKDNDRESRRKRRSNRYSTAPATKKKAAKKQNKAKDVNALVDMFGFHIILPAHLVKSIAGADGSSSAAEDGSNTEFVMNEKREFVVQVVSLPDFAELPKTSRTVPPDFENVFSYSRK